MQCIPSSCFSCKFKTYQPIINFKLSGTDPHHVRVILNDLPQGMRIIIVSKGIKKPNSANILKQQKKV